MNINTVRTDAHVVPAKGLWDVKVEGNSTYSGFWNTKLEATAHAMRLARMMESSVILHNRNGRISDVWSYDAHRGVAALTTKETR